MLTGIPKPKARKRPGKNEPVVIGDCQLYLGNCLDILPTLGKVDVVITDPPYGIGYVTNVRKQSQAPDAIIGDEKPQPAFLAHVAPILAGGGALYLATRFDVAGVWQQAVAKTGLIEKTPIFWDKGNRTAGDLDGDFGAQVEIFLFAHKGRHRLREGRPSNLWRFMRDSAGDHPTPKPVGLMMRMIRCSTDRSNLVLDPFMGSGSTGVAAVKTHRKFIGIEIEPKYFDIACKRIEKAYSEKSISMSSKTPLLDR